MKELTKTKVTVRLRKAEDRKEWYIYLESYPVQVIGKKIVLYKESKDNKKIELPKDNKKK